MKNNYKIVTYQDVNIYSATYGQTKTERVEDLVACASEIADWVFQSSSCTQIAYTPSNQLGNNGKITIVEKDVNENSSTYNQTREREISDLARCPLPDTTPNWEFQSEACEEVTE